MTTLQIVAAFLPGVLLLVSEILPFVKNTKANGILHAIVVALTEAEKALPPPSDGSAK